MPQSPALATAESIFRAYFWPLYPEDARSEEGLAAARATDANPARNAHLLAHLDEAASVFAARGAALFGQDLALDLSDASVHRLSAAVTRERRDHWASAGAAGTPESELFNVVVHGAAYVGACITARHGGTWSMRRPAWESVVRLESRLGEAYLAVFHWWLKSLGDDALASGHTLADRYRAHVENACARPEANQRRPSRERRDRTGRRDARARVNRLTRLTRLARLERWSWLTEFHAGDSAV